MRPGRSYESICCLLYLCPALLVSALLADSPPAGARGLPDGAPHFASVIVDAFDPDAWNGVVFLAKARQQPVNFALRIGSRSGSFLDGEKIFDAVGEVGPHAPDASYCRVA